MEQYLETAKLTRNTNGDGKIMWGTGKMVKVASRRVIQKTCMNETVRCGLMISRWPNSEASAALEFIKSFQTMDVPD